MGVTSREILYIVEIIYWVPALILAIFLCKKHGAGRLLGWLYLVILGLLRLVGASTGIAAVHDPTQGLVECSLITFGVGISPLLLALLGILGRLREGMKGHGLPANISRGAHLPIIAGLIMAILAGTKEFDSNPSTRSDGYTYAKIGVMLYLIGFLIITAMAVITYLKRRHILDGELRLALAALISLPFIAVRILYSIIVAFDHNSTAFSIVSTSNTAVVVQSIMSVLMEFIVIAIFLAAGLFVRVIPRSMVREGYVNPPGYDAAEGQQSRYRGVGSGEHSPSYPLTAVRH